MTAVTRLDRENRVLGAKSSDSCIGQTSLLGDEIGNSTS